MFSKTHPIRKHARFLMLVGLLFGVATISEDSASAASAGISPYTRTVCVQANASFTLSWGNYSPYEVLYQTLGTPGGFYYASTTLTSRSYSAWYDEGNYEPLLEVVDNHDDYANASAEVHSGYWEGCPMR